MVRELRELLKGVAHRSLVLVVQVRPPLPFEPQIAQRRIAEVIELEKASGGAVERLRPTAGEELRVTAKPGGLSPSPTSSDQLEEPRPDPPHREAARRGPRGEAGEPAGGVSVQGGQIEGAVRRRDERRGAAVIAAACARERLRAVRDGAGGRDAGQLRAARLPGDVSRCDVQVPQVTAGSTALVAEFLANQPISGLSLDDPSLHSEPQQAHLEPARPRLRT